MARAADAPISGARGGIQRGRGGFMRGANDVPWVADPDGATTKHPGLKADLIALCDARGITVPEKVTVAQLHELLGERPVRVAYGSPSNRAKQIENTTNLVKWGERRVVLGIGTDPSLLDDCRRLVGMDDQGDEYRTLADSIILRAKDAAQAMLAADRGTHGHALTEDHDEGRDWVARAEAGEELGIDAGVQADLVAAWRRMLDDTGLEILAVEASCVDDVWRLAGTLDRIARTTRPLRFVRGTGEIVEVPAGTVLVLDVKTGADRIEQGWWQGYAIQIASYAQSRPYDTEAEVRGEWPWPIDQQHALIAHLDIPAALAGEPASCRLVHVDLVAGREHGGECVVQAKAWEARRDVFAATMLADEPAAQPPAPASWLREAQRARSEAMAAHVVLPDDQEPPDDGDPSDDATFAPLQVRYGQLDAASRSWINQLGQEATAARVPFHAKGNRTQRRFEILRALITLAERGDDDTGTRELLSVIVGDIALSTAVPVGALVGSLSAAEAATFARFVHGDLVLRFTDDGRPQLSPPIAA